MYIFKCIQVDTRCTPPLKVIVHEEPTELLAISWLEINGGGIYRNTLHNFDCDVSPINGTMVEWSRRTGVLKRDYVPLGPCEIPG